MVKANKKEEDLGVPRLIPDGTPGAGGSGLDFSPGLTRASKSALVVPPRLRAFRSIRHANSGCDPAGVVMAGDIVCYRLRPLRGRTRTTCGSALDHEVVTAVGTPRSTGIRP